VPFPGRRRPPSCRLEVPDRPAAAVRPRPFRELDLGNEGWPDPGRHGFVLDLGGEGRLRRLQFYELAMELLERLVAKAGPDVPDLSPRRRPRASHDDRLQATGMPKPLPPGPRPFLGRPLRVAQPCPTIQSRLSTRTMAVSESTESTSHNREGPQRNQAPEPLAILHHTAPSWPAWYRTSRTPKLRNVPGSNQQPPRGKDPRPEFLEVF
jgi:hypothetical protein